MTPAREPKQFFGVWEASGRHLGGIWEASGKHLGGIWEASGRHLGDIHRRFSPLTLPASKKVSYNIWPSVEPRKTQLFHDIWSPFWHLFLADSTLGGAWESPWDHPGSTFASRPQKTSKKSLFWTSF